MIQRQMEAKLAQLATKFPIVSVTGPRQSGKSTLIRHSFPTYEYVSFEEPGVLELFEDDPRQFLRTHSRQVIFDEAQRAPELFSYLQGIVDERNEPGDFILSGSQNFLLSQNIAQSLAGRVGILRLLPLSYAELEQGGHRPEDALDWVFRGGYPRIFSADIDPVDYYPAYLETYLERDVRLELGVGKLDEFSRFIRLCALRTGELLNIASLANDCGIAPATARNWISALSASYIVHLLRPYEANQGKRLIKTPKLYFLDTGLACYLLGIEQATELASHPQRGPLFETAIVADMVKARLNRGRTPSLSFWRDTNKNEIDLVVERGPYPMRAVEIKSSTTYRSKYFDVLARIAPSELGLQPEGCAVVYAGEERAQTARGELVPFRDAARLA